MRSGQILDLCGSPTNTLEPSGGLVRRIWNLVVPVDTSGRLVTPFASVHESLKIFPETMQIFVAILFSITSTYPLKSPYGMILSKYHDRLRRHVTLTRVLVEQDCAVTPVTTWNL